jgi:hypothetical protein
MGRIASRGEPELICRLFEISLLLGNLLKLLELETSSARPRYVKFEVISLDKLVL